MRVDLTDQENTKSANSGNPKPPFGSLGAVERVLANIANNPTLIVFGLVLPIALIAWTWLILAARGIASSNAGGSLGPSMQLLEPLLRQLDIGSNFKWVAYIVSICSPASINASVTIESLIIMFLMWFMMATAMMLPTAAPMLRTYAIIADASVKRKESTASILYMAAGYLAVWAGFSLQATLLQAVIIAAGRAKDMSVPVVGMIGGIILLFAGLYQFSSLKNACLGRCRNPYTILIEQWSGHRGKIFKLGVQQGLFCLGCCWALMLVMLTVGTMNLLWMAFLTLVTLLEKTGEGKAITRAIGIVLLAWGAFLMLNSFSITFS